MSHINSYNFFVYVYMYVCMYVCLCIFYLEAAQPNKQTKKWKEGKSRTEANYNAKQSNTQHIFSGL